MSLCKRVWVVLFLLLVLPLNVGAQAAVEAALSPLDTSDFPTIRMFLQLQDGGGKFVAGLGRTNIQLSEDGRTVPLTQFSQLHPGVQFVVALNPGRSFAIQNSRGISRYDMIIDSLLDWSKRRSGSTIDDLSLLVSGGPQVSHLTSLEAYSEALSRVDTESGRDLQPSLDILSQAIDLAADSTTRPGMGRAVLFVTPPLEGPAETPFADLVSRANQNNIQIDVWMVASEGSYPASAAEELVTLAEQTGGSYALFTGVETLPDPEASLDTLRHTYYLEYSSQARDSGTHQVALNIRTPFGELETPPQSYEINVRPPDPAFVSPVFEITRQPPAETGNILNEEIPIEEYLPEAQDFEILVSFPDERVRQLVRTTLLVDGIAVDENSAPPFERLTWDLREETANGTHMVSVEAEDVLGLTGRSIETLVQITVVPPAANRWTWVFDNIPLLSGLVALLAVAVVFLVLVLRGTLRPRILPRFRRSRQRGERAAQPEQTDEQLQERRLPKWIERLRLPQRTSDRTDIAYLIRIDGADGSSDATPIPITDTETLIGSDPSKAALVIDDPAIEALHATLTRTSEKHYLIQDQGSVAGTWLNYSPVPEGGIPIEHGDLLHIGRIGFRFNMSNPPHVRKPIIIRLAE